jgi:preprotein translocase subunit SecG
MFVSIIIVIVAILLALVVLAQNPKGGGLAAGFSGAQQIGGVQRTADFLEKSTWSLAAALMVLCLVSSAGSSTRAGGGTVDPLDEKIEVEQAAPANDAPKPE